MDDPKVQQIKPVLRAAAIPPSVLLPPIRKALGLPCEAMSQLVEELARIYIPDVLGTEFQVVAPAQLDVNENIEAEKKTIQEPYAPTVDSRYGSIFPSGDEPGTGEYQLFLLPGTPFPSSSTAIIFIRTKFKAAFASQMLTGSPRL